MKSICFYLTLVIARMIYLAIKILNKSSGTSFVGMVTLKICPRFLAYCREYVKQAITITGTNGKSTTSGILAHILDVNSASVVHNLKGANMLTGVANMFALCGIPFKNFDYAVIESDEAYLNKVYDDFKADYLLVTNLFNDQVDRYANVFETATYIQKAIDKNPEVHLLLNADDPVVSNFGKDKQALYFGFEDVQYCSEDYQSDNKDFGEYKCVCGHVLSYQKQFLAQEGHYSCESCGYKRPEPDFKGYAKVYADYSEIKVVYQGKEYDFSVNLIGLYNAYNALAAVSHAILLGVDYAVIVDALASYKTAFGRSEKTVINGHEALIQLIKNPAGAGEVVKTVDLNSNILIGINNNIADGTDISWLWDTDFSRLKDAKGLLVTSGIKAKDMAKCLVDAGISEDKIIIEEDVEKAVELVANPNNKEAKVTILPSYTVLMKLSRMKF